jgi:hypothetical protein
MNIEQQEQHEQVMKFDPEQIAGSCNGFDELAIERAFGRELTELGESTRALRALLFVVRRRDGLSDPDAYRDVMGLSLSALMERFEQPEDGDVVAQIESVIEGKD